MEDSEDFPPGSVNRTCDELIAAFSKRTPISPPPQTPPSNPWYQSSLATVSNPPTPGGQFIPLSLLLQTPPRKNTTPIQSPALVQRRAELNDQDWFTHLLTIDIHTLATHIWTTKVVYHYSLPAWFCDSVIKFSQKQCKTISTKSALKQILPNWYYKLFPSKSGLKWFLARVGINLFLPEMAYYWKFHLW